MTIERHQRIAELYDHVVELSAAERIAFLETTCAGDQELRRELESLLAFDGQAAGFIEEPAPIVAAALLNEEPLRLPAGYRIGFYRIVSPLGAGGMGEVYLAEDTRLGRRIALKLLPSDFTQIPDRLRWFEREARAASALNHPNIITIHDIGQVEGRHFIATEFIDGQTLREKMAGQPMSVEEALAIAVQAAGALSAAHLAGVVHRDIKPENIMVRTDGYVKVLDFGLAMLNQTSESGATEPLTKTGALLGTFRYMSPEQARAQKVDARSDVFSLGVVLYEMLAGQSPFEGTTSADVLAAILGREPPVKRDLPEAPEALKEMLARSLHKDRDERYQSIEEMIADLEILKHELAPGTARKPSSLEYAAGLAKRHMRAALLGAAVALLILASVLYMYMRTPHDSIGSIAVLPLINESGNPETAYLADGISDSLINRLYRQFPDLDVKSLLATFPYKGQTVDAQTVGRDLNVRGVLTGRMLVRGDEVSIRLELVDTRDNRRLWGEQYNNASLSGLIQLQDQIVRDMSSQLGPALAGERVLPVKHETDNPEAHLLYLRGRSEWEIVTEERLRKSIGFFLQAVGKDQKYGRAYSGLADAYSLLGEISAMPPNEAFTNASLYAEKALSLDPMLAEGWISTGIVKMLHKWDWIGAKQALNKAREIDPNNPHLLHFYGHYLQLTGQADEAIAETKRALDLAPTWPFIRAELAWAHYCAGQYDAAIALGKETLKREPGYVYASWVIAQAYEQRRAYPEALDELNRARSPSGNWSWIVADIGYVYAKMGRSAEARKIIGELQDRSKREHIDPVLIAYIYIALNSNDEAFRWLEKAHEERASLLPWLKIEPKFEPLRNDRRFADLVQRVGLTL